MRNIFLSCGRYSLTIITLLLILASGCKDDPAGPEPPTLNNFLIKEYHWPPGTYTPIDTQKAGTQFTIAIIARDQYNDTLITYTDSVVITVNGAASFAPDTTSPFEDGWTSEWITITDTGKFTITARQIGGSHTGTSNEFYVGPATGVIRSMQFSQFDKKR